MEGTNMPSATVRISKGTRDTLRDLAAKSGESMQTIIDRAIEEYRRQSFIEQANKAYLALRENPEAWESELKERREWEATLADNQKV
jgi:predicted transcriptional regulator